MTVLPYVDYLRRAKFEEGSVNLDYQFWRKSLPDRTIYVDLLVNLVFMFVAQHLHDQPALHFSDDSELALAVTFQSLRPTDGDPR